MRRFRDPANLPPDARGAVAAIGNFDGVHLGHQAVIDKARGAGAPLGVVTFEPHPREWFAPDAPPFRLMSPDARAHRLEKLGVEVLVELPFDGALAAMPPEGFVGRVLRDRLGLAHAVVGADFRFGAGRAGTAEGLAALGAAAGLSVTIAPLVALPTGPVSSTAIRAALSEGARATRPPCWATGTASRARCCTARSAGARWATRPPT
jgi:riboflavin kinase/FMN adenylyltransferase